jgi:hypothetical protein
MMQLSVPQQPSRGSGTSSPAWRLDCPVRGSRAEGWRFPKPGHLRRGCRQSLWGQTCGNISSPRSRSPGPPGPCPTARPGPSLPQLHTSLLGSRYHRCDINQLALQHVRRPARVGAHKLQGSAQLGRPHVGAAAAQARSNIGHKGAAKEAARAEPSQLVPVAQRPSQPLDLQRVLPISKKASWFGVHLGTPKHCL